MGGGGASDGEEGVVSEGEGEFKFFKESDLYTIYLCLSELNIKLCSEYLATS